VALGFADHIMTPLRLVCIPREVPVECSTPPRTRARAKKEFQLTIGCILLKYVVTTGNLKLNGPGNAFFPAAAEISSNKCKEIVKKVEEQTA